MWDGVFGVLQINKSMQMAQTLHFWKVFPSHSRSMFLLVIISGWTNAIKWTRSNAYSLASLLELISILLNLIEDILMSFLRNIRAMICLFGRHFQQRKKKKIKFQIRPNASCCFDDWQSFLIFFSFCNKIKIAESICSVTLKITVKHWEPLIFTEVTNWCNLQNFFDWFALVCCPWA